jgi:hypothetical protein
MPELPTTLAGALDPDWLSAALADVSGGSRVVTVETVDLIQTRATKARFAATFEDGRVGSYCLKGFFSMDGKPSGGGGTMQLEADFYELLAPNLQVRTPRCAAAVIDRATPDAVLILEDLVVAGATFCSTKDAFAPDHAAQTVEQLALLHGGPIKPADFPDAQPRIAALASGNLISADELQALLAGPRGTPLPAEVKDAKAMFTAMRNLAAVDRDTPNFLVHGDSHAGNFYRSPEGYGLLDWQLLQCGGWALDLAYHINTVLAVEDAVGNERDLLKHYLGKMRSLGAEMPSLDEAWTLYRQACVYGYFLWALTRTVEPATIHECCKRLGSAVARHESMRILGSGEN